MAQPWEMFEEDPQALIEQSAKKYGIDPKFVRAVAKTESNFNPKAVSPKGAKGVMQLMPGTANRLGVSNPFDLAQNIDAGTRELSRLNAKYKGDKTKTAAAYNAGEKPVDESGGVPDYPETRDYVKKVDKEYQNQSSMPWEQFDDKNFGDTETLRAQHESNLAAERLQGIVGPLNTAAQVVRGATPAAAAALGLTPAGVFNPMIYGGGELVARQLEKLSGTRENINPLGVAGQAGLGFIPLPDLALKGASLTRNPAAWYPFLKAPEGALHGMGFAGASHGFDVLTGEEGATPQLSLGEMAVSGLAGGSVAALGSLYRIHGIIHKANDLNYKQGGDQIYAAIDLPKRGQPAEQSAKSFDNWLPIIKDYAATNGKEITNLKDLRNTSQAMDEHFYQQAYEPLVRPMMKNQVSTQPIYDAVKAKLMSNAKLMTEQPEVAAKILSKFDVYQNGSDSFENLLKLRESYNQSTRGMQKKLRMTPGFKANVKGEADLTAAQAIRDVIDAETNKYYSNNIDAKEILRTYRDIHDMTQEVKAADQSNDAMNRLERGQRLPLLTRLARPVARSSERGSLHSVAGGVLTGISEYYNRPDSQVKHGFKLLSRISPSYQLPTAGLKIPPDRLRLNAAPEEGVPRNEEELRSAAFRNIPSDWERKALPPWEGGPTVEGPTPETELGRRGSARKVVLPEQAQSTEDLEAWRRTVADYLSTHPKAKRLPAWLGGPTTEGPTPEPGISRGGPRRIDLGTGEQPPIPPSRLGEIPTAPPSLIEALRRLQGLIYPKGGQP